MPRFSANLGFLWTHLPLIERIEAAAKAGFGAVEMHWPFDVDPLAVKAACARLNLPLLGVNTPVGDAAAGDFGLGAVPGREADFHRAFDEALAWSVAAGASAIHTMAGVVAPARIPEATGVFADNLAAAADRAAPHGITLLLEPINQRDKPGYFYSTIARGAEMVARVRRPNVKIMFDVYHVGVSEGDVIRRLERALPLIGHVQIAAVPSRAEPDEGEIAYPEIFRTLDRIGYAGWVGAEYRPRGAVEDGLGWLRAAMGRG